MGPAPRAASAGEQELRYTTAQITGSSCTHSAHEANPASAGGGGKYPKRGCLRVTNPFPHCQKDGAQAGDTFVRERLKLWTKEPKTSHTGSKRSSIVPCLQNEMPGEGSTKPGKWDGSQLTPSCQTSGVWGPPLPKLLSMVSPPRNLFTC